jgi:hypothetical protein
MRDEVRMGLLDRSVADIGNTQIENWVNYGYRHVTNPKIYEHPILQTGGDITLAEDDYDYALPAGIWGIHNVKYVEDDINLKKRGRRYMDNIRRTDGAPRIYLRWGNTLEIDTNPTSDEDGDTLTVRGWGRVTLLSGSGVTVLEPEWDRVIVKWGVYYGWSGLGVPERAEIAAAEAAALTNEIMEIFDFEVRDETQGCTPVVQRYQK